MYTHLSTFHTVVVNLTAEALSKDMIEYKKEQAKLVGQITEAIKVRWKQACITFVQFTSAS